jgi:hypothetical protein
MKWINDFAELITKFLVFTCQYFTFYYIFKVLMKICMNLKACCLKFGRFNFIRFQDKALNKLKIELHHSKAIL